jgi:hypothetical protein
MVIAQAVGPNKVALIEAAAKTAIRRIVDLNPAFRAAVRDGVAASTRPTTDEKREEAILNLYRDNYLLKAEVNYICEQLLILV